MNHTPVTPTGIEAAIASEHYFTAGEAVETDGAFMSPTTDPFAHHPALDLLTFCVLVTKNGHTVTGEAHCQDPAKFDAETGRTEARKDAINKLWPMAVYAARQQAEAPAPMSKRKPYTWADVASSSVYELYEDGRQQAEVGFLARMHEGGLPFIGKIPAGLQDDAGILAILAEINRQRDLAA